MSDYFFSLDYNIKALIATLFTWFVTALGASVVYLFKDINKINNAVELIYEFDEPTVVIMGKVLPFGVGTGEDLYEAYVNCIRYEFYSAAGGVAVKHIHQGTYKQRYTHGQWNNF